MIRTFQQRVLKRPSPDGKVHPHGLTLRVLALRAGQKSNTKSAPVNVGGLSDDEYLQAATSIGCEPAVIKAVTQTEVEIRGPFDSKGRPTILFERHYFSKLTGGKYDKANPDISNPTPGGYGLFSEQYPKLERAMKLDKSAALRSASWGAFQIMGNNYSFAGFSTVDAFVEAMKASVQAQLKAFVAFIVNSPVLTKALQEKDWAGFAKVYNGPGYAKNQYDSKMKQNYESFMTAKQ
jgi:hypothetical protein